MGLWRIGFGLYGEEETWIPERGMPREWPQVADEHCVPCDVCIGLLKRRRFEFPGKDGQQHTGYRYSLTHYGKKHAVPVASPDRRQGDRRKAS